MKLLLSQFSYLRTCLVLVVSSCAFCVLEAKTPIQNLSESAPVFYGTRKGHVMEVRVVLPHGTVYSASLKKDLRQVLDRALKTFEQTNDEVMVLKVHDGQVFSDQTCWARVLVTQRGARQTWWVKSPEVPEEPDWSDALGMSFSERWDGGR